MTRVARRTDNAIITQCGRFIERIVRTKSPDILLARFLYVYPMLCDEEDDGYMVIVVSAKLNEVCAHHHVYNTGSRTHHFSTYLLLVLVMMTMMILRTYQRITFPHIHLLSTNQPIKLFHTNRTLYF